MVSGVGCIGLGNIGCAIANMVASNGFPVIGWEHVAEVVDDINENHRNERFLPGVSLSPNLSATRTITEVFPRADVLFIGIPSLFITATLAPVKDQVADHTIIVNLAKGMDRTTGLTALQLLDRLFPSHPCIMLGGPAIANEFAHGLPTVVVLAGAQQTDLLAVSHLLDTPYFRTRFSHDRIGVELGGILKNIYTIGLGLFDGKNITSVNFRSVYLTIALEEITRIGVALGGHEATFSYLAGMGDLLATSLSQHSHNRRMGELLAQGADLESIKATMGVIPEGYNTMRFVLSIAEKLHVSLPLATGLWDLIHGRYDTDYFISSFARSFINA